MGIQFPPIAFLYLLYLFIYVFFCFIYIFVQWYKALLNLNLNLSYTEKRGTQGKDTGATKGYELRVFEFYCYLHYLQVIIILHKGTLQGK